MCSTNTDGCYSSPSALSVQLSAFFVKCCDSWGKSNCEMSRMSHPYKMWLGSVSEFLSKNVFNFSLLQMCWMWIHYHNHKTHRNSHTLIGWLLDGNRKGQSLSLSWRNMASEWRVRSNLWTGLQPVVVRCSFHPFPQHGGTSIHKVDVVREQHGCSTSRRSHGQDTRCA